MSPDAHARPSGEPEDLLYDPDVPTPTHGERARTLAASCQTGALSTIARDPAGYPYGSFVTFVLDEGHPVFLISELAEHTKNLRANPLCSLLIAESEKPDPLANGRLTLLGRGSPLPPGRQLASARRAYLETHPNAAYYADFGDFSFWGMEVESLRYIGGYGRMSWVSKEDWLAARPDPIAPHAQAILEHMNRDHASTMVEYCRAFTRARDASAAAMTAVDRYGFEMSVTTGKGPWPVRLAFAGPIASPEEARRELVELARRARKTLSGESSP